MTNTESTSKTVAIIVATFLVSSLLIYQPMRVDWTNRNQTRQWAEARLAPVRLELYVPQNVSLLKETESIRPPKHFADRHCFGANVTMIYGSNRPIDEIREDYALALAKANWEVDPGYKSVEYFIVYKKGDEYHLSIDATENAVETMTQEFKVVYSIFLAYMSPSYNGCMG